ncbi:hypothetical protein BC834DRAFT_893435 [Gloeopeniophorella convolvens]|nr:hypothetical protein BC834DRAFT_893435 [Gloeopeniophorella convolvens]
MIAQDPTPLPINAYDPNTNPARHAAFESCILLEHLESWETSPDELAKSSSEVVMFKISPRVAARTLGYALLHAPTDHGRDCVAREIAACDDDPEILAGLAHLYIFGLIRIFWNPKGPTPVVSADESPRLSFEAAVGHHAQILEPTGATPRRLKEQLQHRDSHCCVFTHRPDFNYPNLTQLEKRMLDVLHVAHIVSQSLSDRIGGMTQAAQDKLRWAVSAAAILDRFTGIGIRNVLSGLDVHNPVNAMMAATVPHILFDTLQVWLTPALDDEQNVIPDTYDVNLANPDRFGEMFLRRVSFREARSAEGDVIPPPSPMLLELHAACARIAHISGAAGVLDGFYRDDGPMGGLSVSH